MPSGHLDLPACWAALKRRDSSADGTFVYSVRTTGVYCRPSCSARAARPENIAFHASCEAAERAGFRPCRRCVPNGPSRSEKNAQAAVAACRLIEQSESPLPLAQLADSVGMSPYHFHRVFKAVTGVTPRAYAAAQRSRRMRQALPTAPSVTAAAYDAGFGSSGRFYEAAPAVLGMSPGRFRAGGAGARIRFAVGECSLGSIIVAATDIGVCAIFLGDDPQALVEDLQKRFPRAELVGADADFEQTTAAAIALVESPGSRFDLPLDIQGTAFQQRVWQALRTVGAGRTASYAEIAAAIGQPKAVRAVAQACGANPIAVAIPCHRVVRRDGALSGYRWGVDRKHALLEREGTPREQ
ncbi:bifunctional DNA-binding transcriptional regulator/O6-methylguanine-DNA methyltransferase Ada [Luteimonas sp. RD2P54]|uniref:Bifunctional DNA-binding transcriptional regulator/O6-methylguanine-DNA methyltransferase Ada n=1 Tax=Luteimonas endophytica TaxID=3042023 RepID=A0ABT6JCK3_9GAMM|nr:bifunctional DNA-binding transcriptional regulator/O6-methylguanine-DNA methyltransferase Ada [Luteimonas endophytica]MDH5824560.1 bifunctional DNA-binding transcriptional regulator/O6-methylguanine-DNA methyltransferase Ada [Luteimonas endophytica]